MSSQYDTIIVGFDLDGVIIDHTANKMRIAARYGYSLKPEDTPTDRLEKILPRDIHQEIREQMYDDTDEALSAPLIEGAFNGLAKLRECGVPYFLISRRKIPMHALHLIERRELWGRYFNPGNTFFVDRMEDKDVVARQLHITHFVDDESRVLALMPSVRNRILFDARGCLQEQTMFHRVSNWAALGVLLGIASQ